MSQYYNISFNDTIFLTRSGAAESGSNPGCKLTFSGAHNLASGFTKTKFTDMNGNLIVQKTDTGAKSRDLEITIDTLPQAVGNLLLALKSGQDDDSDPDITLQASHSDFPSLDLDVEIMDIVFEEGRDGRWFDVRILVSTYGEA